MQTTGILQQAKSKSNIVKLLKPYLNPRIDIEKNLKVVNKYFIEKKSTTIISHELNISASRVSDMIELYRTKIAPLLVRILNGENK